MKKKMQKGIALVLLAAMAVSALTGCGAKEELPTVQNDQAEIMFTTEAETTEVEATEVEATEIETKEAETTEAEDPSVLGLGSVILREEGTVPGVMEATYRLPMLNWDSSVAEAFESWVDEAFDYWKHNIDWLSEDGKSNLDFKAAVYRNILSVDLLVNGSTRPFGKNDGIFSIDLETGEELTAEGILSRSGATWEELEEYIREELRLGFAFEDTNYGWIQNIQAFREQELSSENLKNAAVHMSASMNGSIRFGVPQLYYINTESGTPTAKENPVDSCWYVYLNSFSVFGGAVAEDASAWIADGETGTVEAEYPADYRMPKLVSDRIDQAAFDDWANACLSEWKESVGRRNPEYVSAEGMHLNYRAFVMENILSVILTDGEFMTDGIWENNASISFDLSTGKKMALNDILEKAGFPMEQLYSQAEEILQSTWRSEDVAYGAIAGIEECRAAALTKENLDKSEFTLWPGDVDAYMAGLVTLRIRMPYSISNVNGIQSAKAGEGHMRRNILVPGLNLR